MSLGGISLVGISAHMCLGNWIEPSASAILIWISSPIKIWLWAIKLKVSLSRSFEEIKTFPLTSWEKNPDWRSANWPILIQKAPFVNLTFSIHAYQTLDEPMKKNVDFESSGPKTSLLIETLTADILRVSAWRET